MAGTARGTGQIAGQSFDLDFHTIMHYGDDVALETHYVPRRSQRTESVLTFFAQDGETRNLVYANATCTKASQAGEVLALRLVTYHNLHFYLDLMGSMRAAIAARADWAEGWWTVELRRAMDPGHPDDKAVHEFRVYDLGFAFYTDATGNRFHYVTFPVTLGLGQPADIEAVRFTGDEPDWNLVRTTDLVAVRTALVDAGIDAFWPDEGDWFNLFERVTRHQMYYQGPLSTRPNTRPWSLHRNGYPGIAQWGGWVWSGDTDSAWKTLEAQIAVGLNYSSVPEVIGPAGTKTTGMWPKVRAAISSPGTILSQMPR